MKNKSLFGLLLFTVILSFASFNCNSGGTSNVTITIDLGLGNKAAFNAPESSIIDHVLRFFTKNAEAAPPTNLTSLTLNITGDGMDTITQSYTSTIPSTITVEVPAGDSRMFEILAHTPSVTFRGTATRSLAGGATVTIPITMGLYETKIVIPDYGSGRILQIDEVAVPGIAIDRKAAFFSLTVFTPYDVDFDSSGRIYIANNNGTYGGIIRIDDINDTSVNTLPSSGIANLRSVKIDRENNLIYYATNNALYRHNLTTPTSLTINVGVEQINTIQGMAFVNSTTIYIAGYNPSGLPRIFNYNPSTQQVAAVYSTNLVDPWDVLYKAPYIYIANMNGAGVNSQIIQLNTNFTSPVGFGQNVNVSNTTSGNFYGPRRFLAILNKKITIIDDDDSNGGNLDKLVSIDNILGTNWTIYGNSTTGYNTSEFDFYYTC